MSFLDRIVVLRFSMDWSDYGRMTWTILYGIISAALAFGLVRLAWHTIPWDWLGAMGLGFVRFHGVLFLPFSHQPARSSGLSAYCCESSLSCLIIWGAYSWQPER